MPDIQKITPCLWFDSEAEEAADFYTSVFDDARIVTISRYGPVGQKIHGKPAGSVLTVDFELEGQAFTALNGGPAFTFNEAISLQVFCEDQQEIDYFWEKLSEGGDERAKQCGWLKDRFGVSWQVVPTVMNEILSDLESEPSQRAFAAMMEMKKIDIDVLRRAYDG